MEKPKNLVGGEQANIIRHIFISRDMMERMRWTGGMIARVITKLNPQL